MLALDLLTTRPMARAITGLVRAGELEARAAEGLFAMDVGVERYAAGAAIGSGRSAGMKWLVDGWVCEARPLPRGRRQIFSFAVPGDVVEAPSSPRSRVAVAMTAVECADAREVSACCANPDAVLEAMRRSARAAIERRYEHLARLGRRSAVERLASLLLELHDRLAQVGLVNGDEFALPLRHEDLADALGLSPVHVTRCLRILRLRGAMTMKFRRVEGFDRGQLEKLCA